MIQEKKQKKIVLNPKQVKEEIERTRKEIAHDLKALEPDAEHISRALQFVINT